MSIVLSVIGLLLILFGIFKGRNFTISNYDSRQDKNVEVKIGRPVMTAAVGLGMIFIISTVVAPVRSGTRGIVTTFQAASDTACEPGLNLKLPWQEMVPMSVRREIYEDEFSTKSSDLQRIGIRMATVYQRNPEDVIPIYKRVKFNSENVDIRPGAQETLRSEVSKLDAPLVVQQRDKLSDDVQRDLGLRVKDYGLTVVVNSIQNVDFSEAYDHQVEEKVIRLERAQMEEENLRRKRTLAEITAIRQYGVGGATKEHARGDSESRRILADAEAYQIRTEALAQAAATKKVGEAEAQRAQWVAQAVSGKPNVLAFEAIQGWNGQLPNWMSSTDQMLGFVTGLGSSVTMSEASTEKFELAIGSDLDARIEEFLKRVNDRSKAEARKDEGK